MTTTSKTRKGTSKGTRKGAGSVQQRANGTYAARWMVNGAQRFRGGFATEDEARAFVDREVLLAKLSAGDGTTGPEAPTVAQYVEAFLAVVGSEVERGDRKVSTLSSYRDTLAYVLRDRHLSALRLDEVTGRALGTFYDRLRATGSVRTGRGVGEGTVRVVHKSLSAMYSHAVEAGAVNGATNPTREVPRRQRARAQSKARQAREAGGDAVDPWRWAHVEALLAATEADPTPERVAACLAAAASLRVGEVCGLSWDDVDLDANGGRVATLTVRRTRSVVAGNVVEGTPKTALSAREVPLVPQLRAVLVAHRARQREALLAHGVRVNRTTPVVAVVDPRPPVRGERSCPGDPWRADTLSRRTRSTLAALDLPPVDGLHALRHVFGAVFANEPVNGVSWSMAAVSVMMGHASPAFTAERYNRSNTSRAVEAVLAGMTLSAVV